MKTDKIQMKETFPVDAKTLYNAWLDSKEHSAFTGGEAVIKNKAGTNFSAWDKYITGKITALEKNKRIVQTWRTVEFPDESKDSTLEIILKDTPGGCELTLNHWDIPHGDGKKYKQGWKEHYFTPMKEYFIKPDHN